jgi:ferredoxin
MNILRYGPNKAFVKFSVKLSWPIMIAAKKFSAYPVLRWIINPFFAYPYNEVTSIPIQVDVKPPDNMALPQKVVEKIIEKSSHIFILDQCICRDLLKCTNHPANIGCMALGSAIKRIHPSHGHVATKQEAISHIKKASDAGLIANVAHTWIDPIAFGLPNFNKLMFICFCDDCCCLYRTHLKNRGPNLDAACKKLPGLSIEINKDLCNGCGICAEKCFVSAMKMKNDKAFISESCKGCGRCIEACPQLALSLKMDNLDATIDQMLKRIENVADIASA